MKSSFQTHVLAKISSFFSIAGNRISSVGDTRTIRLGKIDRDGSSKFPHNKIISSKYTVWNFIPKNIYEQFRRIANFYFLCMGLIACVIESPVSPVTSIAPLVFVLIVTAIKQAYEDYLRHRADRDINNYLVTVIRNNSEKMIRAQDIQVGDLIKIVNEQDVPCDIVLLLSSDAKNHKCFITTTNLDGETNIKTRHCPRALKKAIPIEKLSEFNATIECESPTTDLYQFHGRIEFGMGTSNLLRRIISAQQSVEKLLRVDDPITPSTSSGQLVTEKGYLSRISDLSENERGGKCRICGGVLNPGPEGTDEPVCECEENEQGERRKSHPLLTLEQIITVLEKKVNVTESERQIVEVNSRRSSSLSNEHIARPSEEGTSGPSKINNSTPDIGSSKYAHPVGTLKRHGATGNILMNKDSLRKSAIRRHKKTDSNASRVSFRLDTSPRSTLDRRQSWTFERKASLLSRRNSSLLNSRKPSLESADGTLSDPLGIENILLRGSKLKGTDYIFGCVVYTGKDTKLALNSKLTTNKFSTIEKSVNKFLLFYLLLLVLQVIVSTALKLTKESTNSYERRVVPYLRLTKNDDSHSITFGSFAQDFFSFVVLYNYVIPISLYVTMEMQKFIGSLWFDWDLNMYNEATKEAAMSNTSDLNEDLGQVEYLFTDKTGTLTENNMKFHSCSVDGIVYVQRGNALYVEPEDSESEEAIGEPWDIENLTDEMKCFLLALVMCHTVQVREENNGKTLTYIAASPDEKAFVEAMQKLNVIFANDDDDLIALEIFGTNKMYKKLEVLEFTSERKRMSVIVQDEDENIALYCKGAESALIPLIKEGPLSDTMNHVSDFAKQGLRTLVVGFKVFSKEDYEKLSLAIQRARQTLSGDRAEIVAQVYENVESNLTVLGATGIEDELQDGVKETLESLREAGIKVWILTGDKVETAINISFSCGHLKPGTKLLELTERTDRESCRESLEQFRYQILTSDGPYGMVVDGQSLAKVLEYDKELFRDISMQCASVVCCRMSPLQKSEVVNLIRKQKCKPVTAAIGDGANDVAMIQEAHVGLGVMGKEGRQAVRCSDFAFAKFKFLREALLVHGHWYYLRVANLVQYFFYKNIIFITPQFYFLFYNGFSTQPLYDSLYLTCYNVIFTSLPILIYGLFEQDYSAQTLKTSPSLYKIHAKNRLMSWGRFLTWLIQGLWQSVVVFFVPTYMYGYNSSVMTEGRDGYLETFGSVIFHSAVLVANLKLLLCSRYWSWPFIGSILFSLLSLLVVGVIYSVTYIPDFTAAMYYTYIQLLGAPNYWFTVIVICALALIPDIVIDVVYNTDVNCCSKKNPFSNFSSSLKNGNRQMYTFGDSNL